MNLLSVILFKISDLYTSYFVFLLILSRNECGCNMIKDKISLISISLRTSQRSSLGIMRLKKCEPPQCCQYLADLSDEHQTLKGLSGSQNWNGYTSFATFQTLYILAILMMCIVNILQPQFERNNHFKVWYLVLNKYLDH